MLGERLKLWLEGILKVNGMTKVFMSGIVLETQVLLVYKKWLKEMNVIRYKEEAETVNLWGLDLCFRQEWNNEGRKAGGAAGGSGIKQSGGKGSQTQV